MSDQTITSLKNELKELIIESCNLHETDIAVNHINDEAPLIDPSSALGLDSLDALEIVIALEKKYKVRIRNINTARQVLKSINTLADFINKKRSMKAEDG